MKPDERLVLRRLRWILAMFILGLVLSGITAFPLLLELEQFARMRGLEHAGPTDVTAGFDYWILTVRDGLRESYARHPWLAYGTDWLAFAHIVIAVFFLGPLRDPVRNIWVLKAGLISCLLVIPLALVCGEIRQIPWGWRFIDCSFGIAGGILLLFCLRMAKTLARMNLDQ